MIWAVKTYTHTYAYQHTHTQTHVDIQTYMHINVKKYSSTDDNIWMISIMQWNDDNEYFIIKRQRPVTRKLSSFGWHFAKSNNNSSDSDNNFSMRSSFKPLIKYFSIILLFLFHSLAFYVCGGGGGGCVCMCQLHAFSIQLVCLKPLHKTFIVSETHWVFFLPFSSHSTFHFQCFFTRFCCFLLICLLTEVFKLCVCVDKILSDFMFGEKRWHLHRSNSTHLNCTHTKAKSQADSIQETFIQSVAHSSD